MQPIGLLLAFILEIITFACFAWFGFILNTSSIIQLIVSVVLFSGLVLFWGTFMSPRASRKLNVTGYYLVKVIVYGLSAIVINHLLDQEIAISFAIVSVICEIILVQRNVARLS